MNRSGDTLEMTQRDRKSKIRFYLQAAGVAVLAIKRTFLRLRSASVRRRLGYAMALSRRLGEDTSCFQQASLAFTSKPGAASVAEPRTLEYRPKQKDKMVRATPQTPLEKHSRRLAKDVESSPLSLTPLGALQRQQTIKVGSAANFLEIH